MPPTAAPAARGRRPAAERRLHERVGASERLLPVGQPRREQRFLHVRVDRGGREQRRLERIEAGVAELIQSRRIGLARLLGVADQRQREAGQPRGRHRRERVPPRIRLVRLVGGGNLVPCAAVGCLPRGVLGDGLAELSLFGHLGRHQPLVVEAVLLADQPLHRVLDAAHRARRPPPGLGAGGGVARQRVAPRGVYFHLRRVQHVAVEVELRHRQQAGRRPGAADGEHQLVLLGSLGRPGQVLGPGRLAVLVRAEERDVEVVARIGEVVVVAAEEPRRLFHGEHEPNVGVLLVAVEPVLAAAVELDDLAPKARPLGRFLLDGRYGRASRLGGLAVAHPRLDRPLHPRRHVLVGHEHVDVDVGALQFLLRRRRIEAVTHVIVLGRRQFLELAVGHVLVGEDEPGRRDESPRRSLDARRSQADVLQPLWRRLELVLFLPELQRRIVERPHPVVCTGALDEQHADNGQRQQEQSSHVTSSRGARGGPLAREQSAGRAADG